MNWCAAQDHIVASPVGVVDKLLAKQPGKRERVEHHPALPWQNLPTFFSKVLRDHKMQSDAAGHYATAHGFRSTFRDWASEQSYPRELAERALAHTIKSSTEAAYHRTDLLEQRRDMMQAWTLHALSTDE